MILILFSDISGQSYKHIAVVNNVCLEVFNFDFLVLIILDGEVLFRILIRVTTFCFLNIERNKRSRLRFQIASHPFCGKSYKHFTIVNYNSRVIILENL